ncbi:NADH-quinone oxidoreductase subunit L [Pseudactinotalea sp. Z1739]|uniref:NADH-quinone oxidoreductase subunit L n=1 Tax=Pseudactinotalea sp. Z1739 TaxID=3413028 RepID=UPI003C7A2613
MDILNLAWLLVAIPLVSSTVLLLLGRRSDGWGHWLGVLSSAVPAVLAIWMLAEMLGASATERSTRVHLFDWINAGDFTVQAGLLVDPLSVTFALLITFVGTLIHIYSVGYMAADPDRRRFFAYLNLFIAAMLLLVLGDSFALLFVGWEGVGLASYLLIGFWNARTEYAVAAKKAFVMNRVGDMGLLVAMMAMFATFGSVDYETVFGAVEGANEGVLTAIGLLLLLGACGKSAQVPLQAWLGDAMAGPTPVSALIHAATMVTAGVYLIVRAGAIFEAAPVAQLVVVIVGAVTLLFGAIVGCAKDDIKKVLAASTMSQIGYMMLAAGLGPVGYAFAIFHLITHGFFKAGLFLGAGSVMHGMNDDVNMRHFGALRTSMKITWATFALGWLAILGIPPFSGFWSKDKIIEAAFTGSGWQPWVFGIVTLLGAGITAFYMSRLYFMTFHGKGRWHEPGQDGPGPERKPHESGALMTVPMIILAAGSVGLGLALYQGVPFLEFLAPVTSDPGHLEPVLPVWLLITLTLVLVAVGVAIAWLQFGARDVPLEAPEGSVLTRAARADLYGDAINETLAMRPGQALTRTLVATDRDVIDGAVHRLAGDTTGLGQWLRRLQSGYARSYAVTMTIGVIVVLVLVLATRV